MILRTATVGLLCLALFSSAFAVDFTEIARFNIDSTATDPAEPEPQDIGSNPSAVAWNGLQLYVAGYNNSGSFQDTAIVEVTGATALGVIDTPTFSNAIAPIFTPNGRGFSGLDISPDGTQLAAAWDDGQSAPEGLRVFGTSTNSLSWSKELRGASGVAFDPGFPGGDPSQGTGVAWVNSFDSGRRSLQNAATGADIWEPADGMIWHPLTPGLSFITRDIDFDPDTGDMYTRTANEVIFARRNGDNGIGDKGLLADETDGAFINNQHLAFLSNTSDGDFVIYNDRNQAGPEQDFFAVTKVIGSTGDAAIPNFTFIDDTLPDTSAGWYDYDFDAASQTLAILDSSNRNVHIFQVGNMTTIDCDFDGNLMCDGMDIDMLVENIAIGPADPGTFDLNDDGMVNLNDLDVWLVEAGAMNLASGNAYLAGDANLDGDVNGQDFLIWNDNKFTNEAAWTKGDFTANGAIDGQDFLVWNDNKFQSADIVGVPEPGVGRLAAICLVAFGSLYRRARSRC